MLDKFESTNEKGKHDGDFLVNLAIKLYEERSNYYWPNLR